MVSSEAVQLARTMIRIQDRYNDQELKRVGGHVDNIRTDWTPAQKRAMRRNFRKQLKKAGKTSLIYPGYML